VGQLHSNLGEVKNVFINWKNLGKFKQNQLWPNNNNSIQIRAKWNIFIQFWVTSNSFIPFLGTSNSFLNFGKLQTTSFQFQ